MAKQGILTERNVVVEVLEKYRKLPYLWNPTHKLYTNKNARKQGLEIMLKSWRKLEPKANLECMRKKLNNWRAAYRRERKKIEDSIATASEPDEYHKPNLWYYDYLTFLHDDCPVLSKDDDDDVGNDNTASDNDEESMADHNTIIEKGNSEEEAGSDTDDENNSEPEQDFSIQETKKKPRMSGKRQLKESYSRKVNESIDQDCIVDTEQVLVHSNDETSADWFGRAIGCQLKEVSKFQRCLAEKLISEIMFHAKLDQLTIGSSINLGSSEKIPVHSEF
ncbi:alcohol dehydrogenase transcription factor myb/SANT-like domain-containing protein [Phthorimaea operculella]|nr:alcohol dehydrogenase transcription factor myb/SANT-like domain-containing protein [Phthorimaea operculella]